MKRFYYMLLLAVLVPFVFTSCKSKEDKASDLIKAELSKTLYDFDSYQPIETTVKEAKNTAYNDSLCWTKAAVLAVGMEQYIEKAHAVTQSVERAQIWGAPTYYSSSYSDRKYYEYMEEGRNLMLEANIAAMVCNGIADSLNEMIHCLDTSIVVGWEVIHSFRCKTRGGDPEIAHYRYVIDKEFKKILLREDTESKNDKHIREAMQMVIDGWDTIDIIDI